MLQVQKGIKQIPSNQPINVSEVGSLEDTSLLMTLTQGPGAGGHLELDFLCFSGVGPDDACGSLGTFCDSKNLPEGLLDLEFP